MNKTRTPLIIAIIGAFITMAMIISVISNNSSKKDKSSSSSKSKTSFDDPAETLEDCLKKISVTEAGKIKGTVDYSDNSSANLPNIETKYPLTVTGNGEVNIEIFSTSEKAGKNNNGWLNEIAQEFNEQDFALENNGKSISVSVRSIPSGAASDYISNKVYIPQAYTPSNELFGTLASEQGAKLKMEVPSLVSNTAGIAISRSASSDVSSKYGSVTYENIVDAVVNGELQIGYTYPYTSATGLNFLVNALQHFDGNNILSNTAVSKFQQLQKSIPFVCYTTDQMVNAMQSGTLQAGVVEYQAYVNSPVLKGGYEFVPFGYKHSNPLYSVGELTKDQQDALKAFIDYAMDSESQKLAKEYGFDPPEYNYNTKSISGSDIISAQRLWKEEKDSGTPTIALFIADVSGSMSGDPLSRLKTSLIEASKNIKSDNYVGLISYSDDVTVNLPIANFDLEQRSYFAGAVENMQSGGGTATYDALMVGINMINEYKKTVPNAKTMIFVLSDGMCNRGVDYGTSESVVSHYGIPIYTIGYNEEIDSLKDLSSINEAVYIDADSDDVVYELAALFNAQM